MTRKHINRINLVMVVIVDAACMFLLGNDFYKVMRWT